MNNRNNRATRAIVASGSLLAIIFIAIPWVDEYLRLRRDVAELNELELRFVATQRQNSQLHRIEGKLKDELGALLTRSVTTAKRETVREAIIEMVRQSGGRLRRLEIAEGDTRVWAIEDDDPRSEMAPQYEEESRFALQTQLLELQVDGALDSARQVLQSVADQGWLMTTKGLTVAPTGNPESPVSLELQLVLYGLISGEHELGEDKPQLNDFS